MESKYLIRQLWLVLGISLNTMSQSTITAITAILLPQLREENTDYKNRVDLDAWIGAAPFLGSFFGAFLVSIMLDRFGRKFTLLFTHGPITIGWIIILVFKNIYVMIAIRIIQGISIGIRGPISAIIIGECTAAEYRGAFLASAIISLSAGILFPHLLGTFLTWRWTAFVCCLLNVASFFILLVPPDSPIWLVKVGKTSGASQAFRWYKGDTLKANNEFESIRKRQAEDNQRSTNSLNIFKVLKTREFFIPVFITLSISMSYAWCGTFVISTYTVDILAKSFSGSASPYLVMISFDSFKLFVSVLNCFVVKKFKRRHVLNFSYFTTIVALCLMSAYIYTDKVMKNGKDIVLVILLFIYTFGVDIGLSSLSYIVVGEVFSVSLKALALSVAGPLAFLSAFIVQFLSPYLISYIGLDGTFLIYASIVFTCWLVLFFILPETKDKTLQEIEDKIKGVVFADNNEVKHPMISS